MKKKNFIISLLTCGAVLLSSCALARQKQELVWSKWYDNGDGTHTRHNLNDISMTETDEHHFVLTKTLEEPTEVAPGKALYTCEDCACKEIQVVPPTGNYVFDQKVIDDKYLFEKYSNHSAAYYMSSVEGAFGDPRYVFEVSDIPSGYTEVDYVESDGRQWVDTGVPNDGMHEISVNESSKNSRLGADYTELEYIESDGTQFFKTGVKGYAKWTITIQFTKFDVRQLMGYNGSGGNYWGVAEASLDRGTEEGDYETYGAWNGHRKAGSKDVIVDDFDTTPGRITRTLNDELVYGPFDVTGDISNFEYQLLALGSNCFCYAKLYHVEVEKSGVLVHDFVPAQRRGDGAVGLFDIVGNKFLENASKDEFIKGDEVVMESSELPAEYHQVEYIQSYGNSGASSAGQCIDTGLTFDMENDSFELTFQSTKEKQDAMPIGTFGTENYFWLYYHKDLNTIGAYFKSGGPQATVGTVPQDLYKHTFMWKNKGYYVDGVLINSISQTLGSTDYNLTIGCRGDHFHISGKIYGCAIYKSNALARDFVPCYRVSDNVVGLYDLVTNQFFMNSGSGSFTCGSEVDDSRDFEPASKANLPEYYYQLNYIESNGLQNLDTGVVGSSKIEATIKFTKTSSTQIMGYSDVGGNFFGVLNNNKYQYTSINAGNLDNFVVSFNDSEPNSGSIKINDNDPVVFDVPALGENTFKLFSAGAAASRCTALLYSAKIYQNDELVRDFIPVMQKQTRVAGLYDLVDQRFYESDTEFGFEAGGVMFENLDVNNINIFCNLTTNKSHPYSSKINSYVIYGSNNAVRNFVSVIRNADGVAGFIDLVSGEFYTSNTDFGLTYGNIIGHKLDEGRVVKKPTYNEGGEIVYTTVYTNEEIHVSTECTAYKVSFISNNGNLTGVKIFNNDDPSNYEVSMVGYTRNPNTFNYSKSGAYIYFEIPDDGHEYKVTTTSGKIAQVEDQERQYKITGITGDAFIHLRLNDSL